MPVSDMCKVKCPHCGADYRFIELIHNPDFLQEGEVVQDCNCCKCRNSRRETYTAVLDNVSYLSADQESESDIAAWRTARKACRGVM